MDALTPERVERIRLKLQSSDSNLGRAGWQCLGGGVLGGLVQAGALAAEDWRTHQLSSCDLAAAGTFQATPAGRVGSWRIPIASAIHDQPLKIISMPRYRPMNHKPEAGHCL